MVHRTVNHSLHFVDPASGAHTQHIESRWAQEKQKIKAMRGVSGDNLPDLLSEFLWKDKYRENLLVHTINLLNGY